MRRWLAVAGVGALVVALVVTLAIVGGRWWHDRNRSTFAAAAAYAPGDAQRISWTDWAEVRRAVDAPVDADSSEDEVADFLDRAFERDLTSTSALVESTPTLQRRFGFSPASIDWELFAQSAGGAVVVLRLGDGTTTDDVADRLRALGFTPPDDDGGVWDGGPEVLSRAGSGLTPELQYAALVPDGGLVLTSDRAGYLGQVIDDLGDDPIPEEMAGVVDAAGEPLSAVVYSGDQVCSALAMAHADEDDRATGERLVAEAGGVNPLTAYAMAAEADGTVRVVMGFDDEGQARANADSRATLASGPAPGQGGDFGDRFTVGSATATDDRVTLELRPVDGAYVLSDLSSGPVLFATC